MGKDAQSIDGRRVSQTNGGARRLLRRRHGDETVSRTSGVPESSTSSTETLRGDAMRNLTECKTDPKTLRKFIFEKGPAFPHRGAVFLGVFSVFFDDCRRMRAGFQIFRHGPDMGIFTTTPCASASWIGARNGTRARWMSLVAPGVQSGVARIRNLTAAKRQWMPRTPRVRAIPAPVREQRCPTLQAFWCFVQGLSHCKRMGFRGSVPVSPSRINTAQHDHYTTSSEHPKSNRARRRRCLSDHQHYPALFVC